MEVREIISLQIIMDYDPIMLLSKSLEKAHITHFLSSSTFKSSAKNCDFTNGTSISDIDGYRGIVVKRDDEVPFCLSISIDGYKRFYKRMTVTEAVGFFTRALDRKVAKLLAKAAKRRSKDRR